MSECTHNCESCASNCDSRSGKNPFLAEMNKDSNVRHVIGVVSGKGGVGKSLITSLLAVAMNKKGNATAILDADITGPSIPKAFGLKNKAVGAEEGIFPVLTNTGIEVMSLNLINDNETDPVVWRGPILAGTVKQFWTDVIWGEVDYMFVDMPPGTSDVPLTVFQSLPLDGIIVVTSPQELVSMIVAKAVKMTEMMNIPILGIVENFSYIECPDCKKKIPVFGESKIETVAKEYGIDCHASLPIDPLVAAAVDKGNISDIEPVWLEEIVKKLECL